MQKKRLHEGISGNRGYRTPPALLVAGMDASPMVYSGYAGKILHWGYPVNELSGLHPPYKADE